MCHRFLRIAIWASAILVSAAFEARPYAQDEDARLDKPEMKKSETRALHPEATLHDTEVWDVESATIGQVFRVSIARPGQPLMPQMASSAKPRVLYVLDANLIFATAVEMTRLMHQLYGELPPLLVVGIGYPTDDMRVSGELRTRDFTPSQDLNFAAMGKMLEEMNPPTLPEDQRMAGASRFLDFLKHTLKPMIRERFETEGQGIIFGASLGGLFAHYLMMEDPSLFDGYIIASPALWWNQEGAFERAESFIEENEDLDTKAFFAVGALEESPNNSMLAPFKMVTNLERMVSMLEKAEYPSLRLGKSIVEQETHTTVMPVALTRGLRFLLR